jgi:hypothetical protein
MTHRGKGYEILDDNYVIAFIVYEISALILIRGSSSWNRIHMRLSCFHQQLPILHGP